MKEYGDNPLFLDENECADDFFQYDDYCDDEEIED